MRKITVVNEESERSIKLKVAADSTISAHQVAMARNRLCPVGFQERGVLGEYGDQLMPDVPGHRYRFKKLPDGRVQVIAEKVA